MTALRQELPGILNWAIEGCLLWQTEGLKAPESVAASITAYRSEMDTVAGFIEDECHQDPSQKSSVESPDSSSAFVSLATDADFLLTWAC